MSKKARIEALEDWIFQTKLADKAVRFKTMSQPTPNMNYYQELISKYRKKQ